MNKLFQKIIRQTVQSFGIKGREAKVLKKELETHFLDHKEQLILEGFTPRQAEKKVIQNFGDPKTIGELFRNHSPVTQSIRSFKKIAKTVTLLSIATGLYYGLTAKIFEIQTWAVFAMIGGFGAFVAARLIERSRFWRTSILWGFSFLAMGQIFALIGGITLVQLRLFQCTNAPTFLRESNMCTRIPEGVVGISIHALLLILCIAAIHEIFLARKRLRS